MSLNKFDMPPLLVHESTLLSDSNALQRRHEQHTDLQEHNKLYYSFTIKDTTRVQLTLSHSKGGAHPLLPPLSADTKQKDQVQQTHADMLVTPHPRLA